MPGGGARGRRGDARRGCGGAGRAGDHGSFGVGSSEARWDDPPGPAPRSACCAASRPSSARRCAQAQGAGRKLYGFAEHDLVSTFLGTSAGLRLRHDQPAGRVELNAKSADLARSAWTGAATRDFTDVDIAALDAGLARAARLGQARRSALPAGRYETLLPPTAVSDLMVYLYWSAGAQGRGGRADRVQQGRAAAPGSASGCPTLPVTLSSDPLAAGLALRAVRGRARVRARTPRSSTTGSPLRPTAWIQDGSLAALHSSRHSAALAGLPRHARHRQPDLRHLGRPGRRRWRR